MADLMRHYIRPKAGLNSETGRPQDLKILVSTKTTNGHDMGLVARKPVFSVSDKVSFKPVFSATETSLKISPATSLHIRLTKQRITKALIRQNGCTGWSAPVLFANPRRRVFSRRGPIMIPYPLYIQTMQMTFLTFSNGLK